MSAVASASSMLAAPTQSIRPRSRRVIETDRYYDQLGIGDRAELEFFDGPHTIHGQGTFRFLHRHLRWPE
jgi:hypothetical protein